LGYEAGHFLPFIAAVKNEGSCTSSPSIPAVGATSLSFVQDDSWLCHQELNPEVISSQKYYISICFILEIYRLSWLLLKNKFMFTSIYVKFLLFNLLCMFGKTTVVLNTHSSTPVNWVCGLHHFIRIVHYIVHGIWKCDRTMYLMFPVVQVYQIFHVPH
jgi:hypothetical protein